MSGISGVGGGIGSGGILTLEEMRRSVSDPTTMGEPSEELGSLHVVLGPMFSGKTTELIRLHARCVASGISRCAVNHTLDTRYGVDGITSHGFAGMGKGGETETETTTVPCIRATQLAEVWHNPAHPQYMEMRRARVLLINEAQFFADLRDTVQDMVEQGRKRVVVFGLDGDFQRQRFGPILALIPLCDGVFKLRGTCHLCPRPALFSARISSETAQTVIGSDNYQPMCRGCFVMHHQKKNEWVGGSNFVEDAP